VDAAALEFLLSADGMRLLTQASASYDGANAMAVSTVLHKEYDGGHVAAALTQVALRRKAAAKFGTDAAAMFFTPDGLEQATAGVVARRRAQRVTRQGMMRLLDLGCGIGSDLLAFARAGLVVSAVDIDPLRVDLARANLAALGLAGEVRVGDARTVYRAGFDVAFADPSRRTGAGRVFDPDSYGPPWTLVAELLEGTAVVKAAPGIPHELIPAGVEAEWVSLDGQLREAALWSGGLAEAERRATVLSSTGSTAELTEDDAPDSVDTLPVGRYVYEPDDAVVRAHLVTAVAARSEGWLLDPHLAYVSSDRRAALPFARGYEVLDVLPFKEKALRAALRARHVGAVTIKKRGVHVTPEQLRRRLALHGAEHATVILTRTPGSAQALLVRPLR
jgi:SAM-dependent methyltransferase